MKKLLSVIILISCFMPILSKAQCRISKEALDNGAQSYDGENICIYKNEDLENGIQAAYLQMIVIQKGNNSSLLQFVVHISVYSSGSKQLISPNSVQFKFADGQKLEFSTENILTDLKKGVKVREAIFPIKMNDFKMFQATNLSAIKITDNKTNDILICIPDKDAVSKQSNCIAEAVN